MKTFTILILTFIAGASVPLATVSAAIRPAVAPLAPVEFKVTGTNTAEIGKPVILVPENADGCQVSWLAIDGDDLIGKQIKTDKVREIVNDDLEFQALPVQTLIFKPIKSGRIRFICTCYSAEKFIQVIHTVNVKGGDPNDEKKEDDTQPEPPEPDNGIDGWVKSDYLVLVYESSPDAITKELGELMNSKLWLKDIQAAGLNRPLVYDKDSDEGKVLIQNAKAMQMESSVPFMAIIDESGKFKRAFPVLFAEELERELGL